MYGTVTGRPLDQLVRLSVGYVPQVDDVFDPLKVSENLNMGGYLLGKADRIARMEEVWRSSPQCAAGSTAMSAR